MQRVARNCRAGRIRFKEKQTIATADELTSLDIAGLGKLIETRQVSPVEAAEATLARIDKFNPSLNAYISVYPEQALDAAREAEREIAAGRYLGALHGIPLAVKDLFEVAGMQRTCGSRVLEASISTSDATSVHRLKQAGAIIIGLLNLHEFAFGPTGINPVHGTARNPWNTGRICGGSSSGAGCSVASGLAAGALGSDTGGSIRIPAALCGVVGMKQTFGLASRHGIYPLCEDFDHGGPLTRTVRDSALMLQAIAGEDRHDPTTRNARVKSYTSLLDQALGGLKIGVPDSFFFEGLHPQVETAVLAAIDKLRELGAQVRELPIPFIDSVGEAWETIMAPEVYALHEAHIREQGESMAPDVTARMMRGKDVSAGALVNARWRQRRIIREMEQVMAEVDLLAFPATPIPSVPIDDPSIEINGERIDGVASLGKFTRLASLTGQPAISVPCGFTEDNLPIGLQLVGRWFDDDVVYQAAHAYEMATAWHTRQPPLT